MRAPGKTPDGFMNFEENRAYFREFGERLTELRRARGITQAELGEAMGYSQQQIQAFEKGRRRMPLSVLPVVVELLSVSYEELLGTKRLSAKRQKRGPPSKLERQMQQLEKLPPSKRRLVSQMLDGILAEAS